LILLWRKQRLLIITFVDKDSPVGKEYLKNKEKSLFYKDATFYSTKDVFELLWEQNFTIKKTYQTVFGTLQQVKEIQQPENGYGKGSFVVINAKKMNKTSIRFAMAVNHAGYFIPKHFGDAYKYLIYEWNKNNLVYSKEAINHFKEFDEEQTHGSKKKGMAIIDLLKGLNVKVLVSRQFGKNVQMVNRHFIPVIVNSEKPDDIIPMLKKHMKWIEDELNNRPEEFILFTLKNGVLKTIIKKEK